MLSTPFRPKCASSFVHTQSTNASDLLQFHPFYHQNLRLSRNSIDFLGKQSTSIQADPISQSHLAISLFHEMLETEDPSCREAFLKVAEDLIQRVRFREIAGKTCGLIFHRYHPGIPESTHQPWISCQTQGWGMSILMRAYQLSGKEAFRQTALSLQIPFLIDVSSGGVKGREKTGRVFYQKLPFRGRYQHILNGFLSSLAGLYELYLSTGDNLAGDLFHQGLATVCNEDVLNTFDIGYTSVYGQAYQSATPACIAYNRVHVWQLSALAILGGQPKLKDQSEKWHAYSTSIFHRALSATDCLIYRIGMIPTYSKRIFKMK